MSTSSALSALRLVVHSTIDAFDFGVENSVRAQADIPNNENWDRYRLLLHAFCDFDASPLQPVAPVTNYDPTTVAYNFLVTTFLAQDVDLFQVYLELNDFLVTAVAPTRNSILKDAVKVRDAYVCRLSGILDAEQVFSPETTQAKSFPYHQALFQEEGSYDTGKLDVVHAVPWNPGQEFMHVLERMVGFPLPQPDTAENMVTLYHLLRLDFDAFRIYFDADWKLHRRQNPRSARPRHCKRMQIPRFGLQLDQLDDLNLCREVYDNGTTALPSVLWFQLHKLIGDIYYASGRAEEIEMELERAKDAGEHVVCDEELFITKAKYNSVLGSMLSAEV
ncbi:hypothetical protein C8R44DRAFT_873662 [Mycena epipterygia]|nr:hypothetical protein C8R44DRAFT_873662 [Mycena epipterygia]